MWTRTNGLSTHVYVCVYVNDVYTCHEVHGSLRVIRHHDTVLPPDILAMRRVVARVISFIARDRAVLFSVYLKRRIVLLWTQVEPFENRYVHRAFCLVRIDDVYTCQEVHGSLHAGWR